MKKVILAIFTFGIAFPSFAQVITLPEVEVSAKNYKYLDNVKSSSLPQTVQNFERYAAAYDIKSLDYYEDEYDNYFISFFIPNGKILAAYDNEGNLLRTVEKFENIALPKVVAQAILKKYPGWKVTQNAYLVNYHNKQGVTKKEFKIRLEKGNQGMRIKADENGNIL